MKLTVLFLTVFLGIYAASGQSGKLKIGEKAPLFKALTDAGETWDLGEHIGKSNIVVYFYPAAMTGGCTMQACAYRDHSAEIEAANTIVVGVSGDKPEGLKLFKIAENLNFPLLSDESGEIASRYGVPVRDGGTITREVNGKSYELVRGKTTGRWTFVIDKQGKVAYINEQVDAAKDAEMVLQFIKNNL